jgi:propanol-preferring alcohol dehydrogenase
VLHEFGAPLAVEERPEPEGDGIVVRVRGAGVCRTDVHLASGRWPQIKLPLVLGHEIAGEAPELGSVLVYASWGCGECDLCRVGEEQLCPRATEAGWVRDGGYAELVRVPSEKYLFPLGGLDAVHAAPLADAGITPYRAVRRVSAYIGRGSVAVVIGCGGLGQFAVQYLKLLTAATVIAVDPAALKRERALALGADEAITAGELERPAEVVLDFVGATSTIMLGAAVVRPAADLIVIGAAAGDVTWNFYTLPYEVNLTTSFWGSLPELHEVIGLAQRGLIKSHVQRFPLADAMKAYELMEQGKLSGRAVIVP